MLRRFSLKSRRRVVKPSAPGARRKSFVPRFERLEERLALSVSASFDPADGVLRVTGDDLSNNIVIERAGKSVVVNQGAIIIPGGTPNFRAVKQILVDALGDNDHVELSGKNLPAASLNGGDGNDLLIGGAKKDVLSGGAGDDILRGGKGKDNLSGGEGDDTLSGDRGRDTVRGDAGDDLIRYLSGDGQGASEGGDGRDTVQVLGDAAAGDLMFISHNSGRIAVGRDNLAPFALEFGGIEALEIHSLGGDDSISAGSLPAGLVSLLIDGGDGADGIVGSAGNDRLIGGGGNDVIFGHLGDDELFGGDGDDSFLNVGDAGSDRIDGGGGNDSLAHNGTAQGEEFSISTDEGRVLLRRHNVSAFATSLEGVETLDLDASGGDDVITASTGLAGLTLLDLHGGEGDDTIHGGDGDDLLHGGGGNDVLRGARGNDQVFGDAEADLLIWDNGDGNDLLEGGLDDDAVQVNTNSGGVGDEMVIAGNGSRLSVRRENQPFTLDIGSVESLDLNLLGGDDEVDFGSLAGVESLTLIDIEGGSGNDAIRGQALRADIAFIASGGSGDDTLVGGAGDDLLSGDDGADLILGNQGRDVLRGGDQNDTLIAGGGDDFLDGGEGDDTLFGNDGDDELVGGAGDDAGDGGAGTDSAIDVEDVTNVP